jgi:Na+-transporting methylmalonyl-CoA/oxaloacetate decarboxylase gamma subunit
MLRSLLNETGGNMRVKILIIFLILLAIPVMGCAKKEVSSVSEAPSDTQTPSKDTTQDTSETTQIADITDNETLSDLENLANEMNEIEQLLNELQDLESLDFDVS